ncbi:MAG: TauD/TfdA family dioxygenase [Proteobacteria bacterium]|nr:TauD/TfdA family dioxygenase [Pseudomonadota bacterium]
MAGDFDLVTPLPGAGFGGRVRPTGGAGAHTVIAAAERDAGALPKMLAASGGLLLLTAMDEMVAAPELLVRLSRIFGPEVENYRETLTSPAMVHDTVPEIFLVSNAPPVNRGPPSRPEPPLTADGTLPVQFPHRRGWHTDQSYRRPPPDVSLFLAVNPVPKGEGQTLFADGTAAYDALPPALKARVDTLEGLHVGLSAERSYDEILASKTPRALKPRERPQRQPVVRVHPVTGRRALYLCEMRQMDWLEGPFVGLEPGPRGDGAKLLFELMTHLTRPEFICVHEWTEGDLVVWDNRCLVHAATWFDTATQVRIMWRTTVSGNPGAAYAGEQKSWVTA